MQSVMAAVIAGKGEKVKKPIAVNPKDSAFRVMEDRIRELTKEISKIQFTYKMLTGQNFEISDDDAEDDVSVCSRQSIQHISHQMANVFNTSGQSSMATSPSFPALFYSPEQQNIAMLAAQQLATQFAQQQQQQQQMQQYHQMQQLQQYQQQYQQQQQQQQEKSVFSAPAPSAEAAPFVPSEAAAASEEEEEAASTPSSSVAAPSASAAAPSVSVAAPSVSVAAPSAAVASVAAPSAAVASVAAPSASVAAPSAAVASVAAAPSASASEPSMAAAAATFAEKLETARQQVASCRAAKKYLDKIYDFILQRNQWFHVGDLGQKVNGLARPKKIVALEPPLKLSFMLMSDPEERFKVIGKRVGLAEYPCEGERCEGCDECEADEGGEGEAEAEVDEYFGTIYFVNDNAGMAYIKFPAEYDDKHNQLFKGQCDWLVEQKKANKKKESVWAFEEIDGVKFGRNLIAYRSESKDIFSKLKEGDKIVYYVREEIIKGVKSFFAHDIAFASASDEE